jgi:uncharacterized membrane protein YphA (DoxX/SURF4 family)
MYFCRMKFLQRFSRHTPTALVVIRFLLGVVFLVSGIGKLIDASAALHFLEYLLSAMNKTLPVAPQTLIVGLSVVEIVLGVVFVAGGLLQLALKPALIVAGVLLGIFTGVLVNVVGNTNVPLCGCSGALDFGMPVEAALARNIVLMLLIALALHSYQRSAPLLAAGQ